MLYEVVDRLPSPKVEVPNTEVCAAGDRERLPQRGQQVAFDIIEDPGHRLAGLATLFRFAHDVFLGRGADYLGQ